MITPVTAAPTAAEYNRLAALVASLEAEKAEAKAKLAAKQKITCKVGEKGGLSVYGLGRFPVTLYIGQWERLFSAFDQIKAFIVANHNKFAVKE